jgi:hypothetical protein
MEEIKFDFHKENLMESLRIFIANFTIENKEEASQKITTHAASHINFTMLLISTTKKIDLFLIMKSCIIMKVSDYRARSRYTKKNNNEIKIASKDDIKICRA